MLTEGPGPSRVFFCGRSEPVPLSFGAGPVSWGRAGVLGAGVPGSVASLTRRLLLSDWRPALNLAALDCADETNSAICRDFNIPGFPTVRVRVARLVAGRAGGPGKEGGFVHPVPVGAPGLPAVFPAL